MELTIEQALQQAVEAHKAGKLQDAEALYRAILQAQPKHPDANHNLGVLAVSLNKSELALPLFQIALEANPNQGQFWLSYLDALIKTNQLEIAKSVLEQGKKLGLAGEVVDALEAQLIPKAEVEKSESILQKQASSFTEQRKKVSVKKEKKKNSSSNQTNLNQVRSPSQVEVNSLLDHYRKGRYDLAENLAKTISQKYPDHQISWKVLGAVFRQTGRLHESLNANQRAVAISPNDAEGHSNLGNTLRELGRLEEAEVSYSKAIAIKPEFADAHSNLGNTLRELGRLENAEISLRKAIAIKPEFADAHSNLGLTLQELGRLEEAEASYRKAIVIKPDFVEANSNLGNALRELGRLEEAEASYRKAIAIKPDFAKAHSNLGNTLQQLGRHEEAEASYSKAVSLKPDYEAAQYNLGMWYREQGKFKQAAELFLKSKNYENSQSNLLKCWYFLNEQSLFYEELKSLTSQGITDAIIGSFGCRAEIKFGIEKANPFCSSPLNYVFKTDLSKKYDFEGKFVKPTLSVLNDTRVQNRSQNLLINGLQTSGNLFAQENILVNEIKKIIELEIENYRLYFKDSKEGLIKNWPDAYSLHGWIIRMKNGGELRPHMHEKSWISGSIYINVPPKLNINDGNLVVCLEDEAILSESQGNKKNIIDVKTGSLCFFPASLLHYTIPFVSEEERIVLAFDVIPKKKEMGNNDTAGQEAFNAKHSHPPSPQLIKVALRA
jgi:tetratricopeptide (TPR) repeat protein